MRQSKYKLPKGVRIAGGYVQVRVTMAKGRKPYTRNFGLDNPLARELATIHAAEKYKARLLGLAGMQEEAKHMKFKDARKVYYERHYISWRDPSTNAPRTKESVEAMKSHLNVLGLHFDDYYLDDLKVKTFRKFMELRVNVEGKSHATWNKDRSILYSIFEEFKRWIAEEVINPIVLPADNPLKFLPTLDANERERVPDTWELAAAYTWCQENDVGLWDAIEKALLTALRKQDLVALDGSLTVKGIQLKTGEKFDLPITLDRPVDLTNYKKRWNLLRKHLGWLPVQKGEPLNPKHTTWHDLRHWAPTMLGENGFSIKIIQRYTGHAREATAERYTHVRQKALEPAVDVVRKELERIKESQ